MPFTVSHVAAVIPIARLGGRQASRWMPLSALVIGSMTPDFQYLVGAIRFRSDFHSLPGLFKICLPVGLVSLWVFHAFLKVPLLWLLPAAHRTRLEPHAGKFRWWPFSRFLAIAAMLLLGSWTHICWDGLTHKGRVSDWLGLNAVGMTIDGIKFAIFSVLQAASSIVGLLLVLYWYLAWFYAEPEPQIDPVDRAASFARFLGAGCLLGAAAVSVVCWHVIDLGWPENFGEYLQLIFPCVIGAMATTTGLLVIYAGAFWAMTFRRRRQAPAEPRLRSLSPGE